MPKKSFAAVQPSIVETFITGIDDLRSNMVPLNEPHYDDKAFTLFLLLRFHANCSFEFYTNEIMLCELMGLSTRAENRESIKSNILKMEEDGLLYVHADPNKKFFRITLEYEMFMPEKDFVKIYKEEFDQLMPDNKLLLLLYSIKRFQHKDTAISFPSIETIMNTSHISRPTVCKGLERLGALFDIYKARIHFYNGSYKDVNYYKSHSEPNGISLDAVVNIAKQYYSNVKSITKKEN